LTPLFTSDKNILINTKNMDQNPLLSDRLIDYKTIAPRRSEIAECYSQQGYTYIDSKFCSWDELTEALKRLPKSEVIFLACLDPYGKGVGTLAPRQFSTDEISRIVPELRRESRLDWSRVLYRPLES
jgi:hypothetical protein